MDSHFNVSSLAKVDLLKSLTKAELKQLNGYIEKVTLFIHVLFLNCGRYYKSFIILNLNKVCDTSSGGGRHAQGLTPTPTLTLTLP